MIKRLLYFTLRNYLDHKNALLITGMRQVGKTTLLHQIYDEVVEPKFWFDFDNPLDQKVFEDIDYDAIMQRLLKMSEGKKGRLSVFIDEIQNFPEIAKVAKYLIDHYQVKFYLTGSSNFYLKNLFPESMAGRKFLFDLSPFNFREYLYFKGFLDVDKARSVNLAKNVAQSSIYKHKEWQEAFEDYMIYGGFPQVVTSESAEVKKMVLKNIFASFFEKDLKILADYADIRELRDLILLLVPRVGSLLDVTRLSQELGVDRVKVYRYLEILQGVFFIRLLPRFSRSIDRAVAGGKKVYFADTGILNEIGQVNESQLFENTVVNQLINYGQVSFYNKRNTAEIDAILDKETAFEIKLTGTVSDVKKLASLQTELGLSKGFVVSRRLVEKEGIISPTVL